MPSFSSPWIAYYQDDDPLQRCRWLATIGRPLPMCRLPLRRESRSARMLSSVVGAVGATVAETVVVVDVDVELATIVGIAVLAI